MRKLENKILGISLAVLGVAVGGVLYGMNGEIRSVYMEQEREKTALLAATLHQIIQREMVNGRPEQIAGILAEVQQSRGIKTLRMIRPQDAIGTGDSLRKALLAIRNNPVEAKDQHFMGSERGTPVLTYLKPLPNQQQCFGCHGAQEPLLGVLVISSPMERIGAETARVRGHLIWMALATLIGVGVVLKASMRRLLAPVNEAAGRIDDMADGGGDLSWKLPIRSRDELGSVAQSLNRFVAKLRDIIGRVLGAAREETQAVEAVLKNTNLIAEGSEIQALAIESTAQAVSHMDHSIGQITERTMGLASLSEESTAAIMQISASIQEIGSEAAMLSQAVETVSAETRKLSDSSQQMNKGLEKLAVSTDETTASTIQMDRILAQIRNHLHSTVEVSNQVASDAKHGEDCVDQALEGMNHIKTYSEKVAGAIHRLQNRTGDIGKILDVIAEVAEETNLLALNASIIAAQSGEQGKSFGVVAREIKELAERASSSTQEIHGIISSLQAEGHGAVKVIEEGQKHVDEGVARSQRAREALEKILRSAQVAARQTGEIANAIDVQGRSVKKVSDSMQRVNEMIREIAKNTSEQEKSSQFMNEHALGVDDLVQRVKAATSEQSKASLQIRRLVEDLNMRIREIVDLTQAQKGECAEILTCVEQVRKATAQNMDAVGRVGFAVENLMQQSLDLEKELSRFKI